MTDLRMLHKLQELRKELYALNAWADPRMRTVLALCNEAIDLDIQLHRERLGLEAPPDELKVSA